MNTSLYERLLEYSKKTTSFHMPGHKSENILGLKNIPFLELDVTEVPGLDNLYEADGIILEAEKQMARRYAAKDTIFVTNGSTAGIMAAIFAVCNPGDSLIMARNCHHSVWNALILGGIRPIYISPSYNQDHNILGGISAMELEQLLIDNPETKGVIIVSPTYEGLASDVESIAKIVHNHNKILIVDEAHGAHFIWDNIFPKSAVIQEADIVIQSMHKTLPTLTQSALIHIGSDRVSKKEIISKLQLTQTSSPSYLMMGIMDYVGHKMDNNPKIWLEYTQSLLKARVALAKMKNLILLTKDICNQSNIYDLDESKLVIFTYNADITGIELSRILRVEYNIQVEVETKEYIIAMSTVADNPQALEILCKALLEIDSKLKNNMIGSGFNNKISINNKDGILPRDIYYGEKEEIPIEQSIGRISGKNIMLYPPGIPLICIGEVFSKKTVDYIKNVSDQVLGTINSDNQVKVSVSKRGDKHER